MHSFSYTFRFQPNFVKDLNPWAPFKYSDLGLKSQPRNTLKKINQIWDLASLKVKNNAQTHTLDGGQKTHACKKSEKHKEFFLLKL